MDRGQEKNVHLRVWRVTVNAALCTVIAVMGVWVVGGSVQSVNSEPSAPGFEVASVKSVETTAIEIGNGRFTTQYRGIRYSPGRFTSVVPLVALLSEAYGLDSWRISGPDWIEHDLFDVAAVMSPDTTKDVARLMLRRLLIERFNLRIHRDLKEFAVFALVIGKGGLKLEKALDSGTHDYSPGRGQFSGAAVSLGTLAGFLSRPAGRPVIDMTGTQGYFKLELRWTPDYRGGPDDPRPIDAAVFEAVRQLGLQLEPRNAAWEILVIDHASRRPTPN